MILRMVVMLVGPMSMMLLVVVMLRSMLHMVVSMTVVLLSMLHMFVSMAVVLLGSMMVLVGCFHQIFGHFCVLGSLLRHVLMALVRPLSTDFPAVFGEGFLDSLEKKARRRGGGRGRGHEAVLGHFFVKTCVCERNGNDSDQKQNSDGLHCCIID